MRVYIIGAGPGDPQLITLRGAALIASCRRILYTGSLVPRALLHSAPQGALVLDSAGLTLDEIEQFFRAAQNANEDVARVHTGDPSLFGATAEQQRRLDALGIPWEIIPGVSSFSAAAAALGKELTLPEISQTVILTRAEGRTPMPPGERLEDLARHRATLALFLSITLLRRVVVALLPAYGADCPVAVVHKASLPEQRIIRSVLGEIEPCVRAAGIRTQSLILVGPALGTTDFPDSRLYDPTFSHRFRRAQKPVDLPQGP